jgi:hypothetical protein
MPPYGLGKVGKLVPAIGRRESARGRFVAGPDARNQAPAGQSVEHV